eukprot:CCRYP_005823-RE/>CCRYP_005823-RE protein AED:0.49 eAED:0.72 QI:0/0/0/1/1/1/2/0/138
MNSIVEMSKRRRCSRGLNAVTANECHQPLILMPSHPHLQSHIRTGTKSSKHNSTLRTWSFTRMQLTIKQKNRRKQNLLVFVSEPHRETGIAEKQIEWRVLVLVISSWCLCVKIQTEKSEKWDREPNRTAETQAKAIHE